MSDTHYKQLSKAMMEGDPEKVVYFTRQAVEDGLPAGEILQEGLVPGIRAVGGQFGSGEAFLPELIVAGRAMDMAVELLDPLLSEGGREKIGRYLIGTVKGDLHTIGKKIVIMMLKSNGWEVTDVGEDISPERFCEEVGGGDYDMLGFSALLSNTLPAAEATVTAIREAGLRDKIKIMIGGAPVTQEFADSIGADAYGCDAWDAVVKAERLMRGA